MTVRWTVRAATDRGPQAESRVLFGAPKKKHSRNSVGAFLFGAFRCGNKPLVLPGVKDGFSKAKTGELKASPKG